MGAPKLSLFDDVLSQFVLLTLLRYWIALDLLAIWADSHTIEIACSTHDLIEAVETAVRFDGYEVTLTANWCNPLKHFLAWAVIKAQ